YAKPVLLFYLPHDLLLSIIFLAFIPSPSLSFLITPRPPPPASPLFPYTTLFRSRRPTPSTTTATSPCCGSSTSPWPRPATARSRSEEHTSELQSRFDLVCRLLLEKKIKPRIRTLFSHVNPGIHSVILVSQQKQNL